MPFCSQCAQAIPDGARFCSACGAAVATAPALRVSQAPTQAAPTAGHRPESPAVPPPSTSGIHGRFDPGTRLGTRYRIVALLGRGGMGEVYRADDLELGQSVALKFLPSGVATEPAELARFRGEVRVARQIAHPNVCRVYDIGEADGHVFLSMEYIDGEDLASVLRRMGRPTPDKAIEIARQICLGLTAAHEGGMLHRDLKPANVMIDGRGRARITDFGLAGLVDELAKGGEMAGTPAYMAPEQLSGGHVSVRSDLYSLGLVLYEVFTGKRAFEAKSVAELQRKQESASLTTPSAFARDIDPAVERAILHCLERDAEARPASAYAVLAALPGGDPLAAALAAGETPSPELVANAGVRGTQSVGVALACLVAGLAGIGVWTAIIGPELKPLAVPAEVLAVRSADLLARTGSFVELPRYTADGFDMNRSYLRHLRTDRVERGAQGTSIFYWRRWSPRPLEATDLHVELVGVNDPPPGAAGQATVLFDPEGRLIGLRAIPPDTVPAATAGRPDWPVLWNAAGLDPSTFTAAALAAPVPATCDTAVAWSGSLPWNGGERVTVQMGGSRGRLVHFTMVHDWGASTAPAEVLPSDETRNWGSLLINLIPLAAGVLFGVHNLRLRRGDWRNATRIALFVFAMNMLVALFASRLSEIGLVGVGMDWARGRALGHSLIHGVEMWFAYVALEPYVRRLWPQMLVSWTRLVSGRVRDPLVGRDLLIGATAGSVLTAIGVVAGALGARSGLTQVPTLLSPVMLAGLTGMASTSCLLAYSGSICVLSTLQPLVVVLLLRLLLRRTWPAVTVAVLVIAALGAVTAATDVVGWPIAILGGALAASSILVLMRFGLLAGAAATFVSLMIGAVPSLDLSSWYADRALLPAALLVGLFVYGAVIATAGRPILGDPLREPAGR